MKAAALCMGIGGLDLAIEQHFGTELAWCAEYEAAPSTVIAREWPGVPNLQDLTLIDWRDVEPVDVLSAGYPCQPFSHAGKRKGKNDDRHLWPYVAEAVRVLRPRYAVFENVAGHLTLGFGDVLRDLAEAGFDAEWCLLRASDVGAPHQRERVFIVATPTDPHGGRCEQRDQGIGVVPEPRPDRSFAAPNPHGAGPQRRGGDDMAPREVQTPALHRSTVADADEPSGQARHGRQGAGDAGRLQPLVGGNSVTWGHFEPAIRRWERTLGRPTPAPTDDLGRLSPAFVEWMMGYPAGWVADLGRTAALKALGNAVVPQQGLAALRELAPLEQEVAA